MSMIDFLLGVFIGSVCGTAAGFLLAMLLKANAMQEQSDEDDSVDALIAEREYGPLVPDQSFAERLMATRLTH